MRVLVYPHLMEVGGSQLNAIELAAALRDRGHEVVLFGPRGDLTTTVRELGLEYVVAPVEGRWPSAANCRSLLRLVRARRIDVVHGYEWGPGLELLFGVDLVGAAPVVTTVLSMSVPSLLPRHSTLVVGTRELWEECRTDRRDVHLIEPPIDTERYGADHGAGDTAGARLRLGIPDGEQVVAVVCRMSSDLGKAAGVLEAAETVRRLDDEGRPVRLLVVGDGPELPAVRQRAEEVNAAAGRTVVDVRGQLLDPTDAYVAADVVLGMGSSVLKAMACRRPVVVQGERGFWETLDEGTLDGFLQHGWWGGDGAGADDLEPRLRALLDDPVGRLQRGLLGRRVVVERYSLTGAAVELEKIYGAAIAAALPRSLVRREAVRSAYEELKFRTVRRLRSIRESVEESIGVVRP